MTHAPLEGYARLRAYVEVLGDELQGELLADALRACASATYIAGEFELGVDYMQRSLDEYTRLGNDVGVGHMMMRLGVEAYRTGELERAVALADESRARCARAGYRRGESQALMVLGNVAALQGDLDRAAELFRAAAEDAAAIGFTWWEVSMLAAVAETELGRSRPEEALAPGRKALAIAHRIGDRQGVVWALAVLAVAAARTGDAEGAGRHWGAVEAEEARARVGQWELQRHEYEAKVREADGAAFERGRSRGRQLTLDEAVEDVLG